MIIPSSPADRQALRSAVVEIVDAMTQMAAHKDHIKDIIDTVKDKYEVEPKMTRKLAKTLYDRSIDEIITEAGNFEQFYESVIEQNADD